MRLTNPLPSTIIIESSKAFVRLDVRRRKWLLPPFVRTSFPEPVRRKRFEVALWVLSLYFLTFTFLDTTYSFHKNTAGWVILPRRLTSLRVFYFLVRVLIFFGGGAFVGAKTSIIRRPSSLGDCSIVLISDNSSAISRKSSSAISG